MSFALGPRPARRRPSLTPMIDVVFLLLVFFMLAARFGQDLAIPLAISGAGETWQGPPRLVEVAPDGVSLNGVPVETGELAARLAPLMDTEGDAILLRPRDGADLQALVAVMEALRGAGFTHLLLMEGR